MKKVYLLIVNLLITIIGYGQGDYLGAGNDAGIKIMTSSNSKDSHAFHTADGQGLDAGAMEAARFFSQASFGQPMSEVVKLADGLNFEGWIDNEFAKEANYLLPQLLVITEKNRVIFEAEKEDPDDEFFGPYFLHFNYTWWDNNKKSNDQLRQRIAYALSQILVISSNSNLFDYGEAQASYYDVLLKHAFGNYRELLMNVTLHPAMGLYLSHLSNPKTNDALNIHPDENYAREIMQLFSIGLYELNRDGTRKTDDNGEWIPTYKNSDVKGLAKVFTGLGAGALNQKVLDAYPDARPEFDSDFYAMDRTVPMNMYESQHEQGEKKIIGDFTVSSGQSGMKDIENAVTHIFNHENVGPFIAFRLIQQLVKSNPSPDYVDRVADAFNNNGNGDRGDLKAVIKAVLLDGEARDCAFQSDPIHGKLREPMLRQAQVFQSFKLDSPTGDYWNNGFDFGDDTRQAVLRAPSVFNFFTPDHQPVGPFTQGGIFAPEFKIHDSQSSVGYVNQVGKWTDYELFSWDFNANTENVNFDWDELRDLAEDPQDLINYMDVVFTHGNLSEKTRSVITEAMREFPQGDYDYQSVRIRLTIFLVLISPDYTILK